jgi:hypothetical protein
MKRIILTLSIVLIATVVFAQGQIRPSPWGTALRLSAADSTWRNTTGSLTSDTVTGTGTEKYTKPFQIYDGHIAFGWQQKNTSAAADTDSVKVKLYRAPFSDGPWVLIDSTKRGGRADTLATSAPWVVALQGKGWANSWWRVGYLKIIGVPKMLGFWRGND